MYQLGNGHRLNDRHHLDFVSIPVMKLAVEPPQARTPSIRSLDEAARFCFASRDCAGSLSEPRMRRKACWPAARSFSVRSSFDIGRQGSQVFLEARGRSAPQMAHCSRGARSVAARHWAQALAGRWRHRTRNAAY